MFFAKLVDVYSYYVFDTPTLFACLVTSVDEELKCSFFVFLLLFVMTGKSCDACDASAYPRAEFKVNGESEFFCDRLTAQSST